MPEPKPEFVHHDDPDGILPDKGYSKLQPLAREKYEALKVACAAQGLTVFMTEGFRSPERQLFLYKKGRTQNQDGTWIVTDKSKIVTNVGPGKSNHQGGRAFDLAMKSPPHNAPYDAALLDKVGAIGESLGQLRWGGRFVLAGGKSDKPHFELLPEA